MKTIKSLAIVTFLCLLIFSCEKKNPTIVDSNLSSPFILSTLLEPDVFDTAFINARAEAKVVSDITIKKVTVTVKNPSGSELGIFELKNDGILPDTSANDSIYTGYVSFNLSCRLIGAYSAEFLAENTAGLFSPKIIKQFNVINSHDYKPLLSGLIAPDSLRRPSGIGTDTGYNVFFQVYVTDPDGPCDVKKAFFNSYNSLGHWNSGNPFLMYDDGNIQAHGDTIAGDNHYSFIAEILPNGGDSAVGTFRYDFLGQDRSDSISNPLTHYILIHR